MKISKRLFKKKMNKYFLEINLKEAYTVEQIASQFGFYKAPYELHMDFVNHLMAYKLANVPELYCKGTLSFKRVYTPANLAYVMSWLYSQIKNKEQVEHVFIIEGKSYKVIITKRFYNTLNKIKRAIKGE